MGPGDPKAAPGSPAHEYGSQVANLQKPLRGGFERQDYSRKQSRHGHTHIDLQLLADVSWLTCSGLNSCR